MARRKATRSVSSACSTSAAGTSDSSDVDETSSSRTGSSQGKSTASQFESSLKEVPIEEFHVGMKVQGEVRSICRYGIFIDIGAVKDALLSAPRRVRHGLSVGKKLENCCVLSVDHQKGHLKVSILNEDVGLASQPEDCQSVFCCHYFREQDNRQAFFRQVHAASSPTPDEDSQRMLVCHYFREQDSRQKFSKRAASDAFLRPNPQRDDEEDIVASAFEDGRCKRSCAPRRRRNASRTARWRKFRAAACKRFWVRQALKKVAKETEPIAAAYSAVLVDLQALVQKLAVAASLPPLAQSDDLDIKGSNLAGNVRHFQEQIVQLGALLPALERVQKAKEVLTQALCCPLSHDIFNEPMCAPDGRVYEKKCILEWLQKQPLSPLTKQPMRPYQLLRDRAVEEATAALLLLLGDEQQREATEVQDFDQKEEHSFGEDPTGEDQPLTHSQLELYRSIQSRDEVKALRLLEESGTDTVEGLNVCVCRKDVPEEGATLVHLALLNGLPKAALAIARHPAFQLHREVMGNDANITAVHLAAALGHLDICQALIEGGGLALAGFDVERSSILTLSPRGDELILKRYQNAVDLAEQEHHHEIAAFLQASIDTALAQL